MERVWTFPISVVAVVDLFFAACLTFSGKLFEDFDHFILEFYTHKTVERILVVRWVNKIVW